MIWQLMKREFSDRKISLIAYCIGAFLFLWLYAAVYPTIQESASQFDKLLQSYPKEITAAFGIEDLSFNTFEKYIGTEHFSFVWPLLVIILMMSRAGNAIAGEIEKGTMGLLLSMPVTRLRIFAAKYLSGLTSLTTFIMVSVLGTVPLVLAYGFPLHLMPYLRLAFVGVLFGWAVFALAIMFSSLIQERGKSYFAVAGILLVMYVLNIVAALNDSLDWLKYTSIFYYQNAQPIIVKGEMPWLGIGYMSAIIVVFSALAIYLFNKKDISV